MKIVVDDGRTVNLYIRILYYMLQFSYMPLYNVLLMKFIYLIAYAKTLIEQLSS